MNKLKNILVLSLLPIFSFAQRADRFGGGNKEEGIAGPTPIGSPINQYEIALMIIAVSIIMYFVYKQYVKKQA